MKVTACVVCWSFIKVPDDYNDLQHKGVCSTICASHENMFCDYNSNENIGERNQRDFDINTWELEKRKRYGSQKT